MTLRPLWCLQSVKLVAVPLCVGIWNSLLIALTVEIFADLVDQLPFDRVRHKSAGPRGHLVHQHLKSDMVGPLVLLDDVATHRPNLIPPAALNQALPKQFLESVAVRSCSNARMSLFDQNVFVVESHG